MEGNRSTTIECYVDYEKAFDHVDCFIVGNAPKHRNRSEGQETFVIYTVKRQHTLPLQLANSLHGIQLAEGLGRDVHYLHCCM